MGAYRPPRNPVVCVGGVNSVGLRHARAEFPHGSLLCPNEPATHRDARAGLWKGHGPRHDAGAQARGCDT